MSQKIARIVSRNGQITPNGRERITEVRAGEKGTGQVIGHSIISWPWSWRSEEAASQLIDANAQRAEAAGYKVLPATDPNAEWDWSDVYGTR